MPTKKLNLIKLRKTSDACPSQWEGQLSDGRYFYARYRSRILSYGFGYTINQAEIDSRTSYISILNAHPHDGYMKTTEMLERTGLNY